MCGRYTLTQPSKIRVRFKTANDIENVNPFYNIAPAQYLPTITRNSPNRITIMKWGFIPSWSKDKKFSLINIRSETVKEKSYFANILSQNRCLIPSDGFFEWRKLKTKNREEKVPYFIHLKNNQLFSFAGIYTTFDDAEGKEIFTFAILTSKPNPLIKKIHNRMPVILLEEDENSWLDKKTSINNLFNFLKPYPVKEMESYKISMKVNDPRNDDFSVLTKILTTAP